MASQKQFGVWMEIQTATAARKEAAVKGEVLIMGSVKGSTVEKTTCQQQQYLQTKFFKEIIACLQNAHYINVKGTKRAGENFIHYNASTPQFKKTKTAAAAFNKRSDEKRLGFMTARLN